jgi:hypothetical protein
VDIEKQIEFYDSVRNTRIRWNNWSENKYFVPTYFDKETGVLTGQLYENGFGYSTIADYPVEEGFDYCTKVWGKWERYVEPAPKEDTRPEWRKWDDLSEMIRREQDHIFRRIRDLRDPKKIYD